MLVDSRDRCLASGGAIEQSRFVIQRRLGFLCSHILFHPSKPSTGAADALVRGVGLDRVVLASGLLLTHVTREARKTGLHGSEVEKANGQADPYRSRDA
jgi:hypothetical protein